MRKGNDQPTPFNAHSRRRERSQSKKPTAQEAVTRSRIRDAEWHHMMKEINEMHAL
ncbi:hypothetical protein [Enterovibrio sp. 27052020O]|uniref:hypothetical protein n=1 Tax=Enterovibrio sp. 27052020O TaxID=3241166 RepID=UPI00388E770E